MISFGYVDNYAKHFLILYPTLEHSTTGNAILRALAGEEQPRPKKKPVSDSFLYPPCPIGIINHRC